MSGVVARRSAAGGTLEALDGRTGQCRPTSFLKDMFCYEVTFEANLSYNKLSKLTDCFIINRATLDKAVV